MTQISKLTNESINPSPDDYLVVDNGTLTQKCKVKNLPFSVDTTELQTQINSKANFVHGHQISDVEGLATTVSGLELQINGKASVSHTHSINQITNLQTALDGKINVGTVFNAFDYDQSAVPSNTTIGKTWRERDSNNWIVRDWFFDGTDWQSMQEFISNMANYGGQTNIVETASATTAGDTFTRNFNFPTFLHPNAKGVYFKDCVIHLGVATPNDVNSYWRLRPFYIQTGTSTTFGQDLFTSDLIAFRNYDRWLNLNKRVYRSTFQDVNLSGLAMNIKSFNSPGQMSWSANVSYRLIRQSS